MDRERFVEGGADDQMDGEMDECVNGRVKVWSNGQMSGEQGKVEVGKIRWMGGTRMGGWIGSWFDGWMERWMWGEGGLRAKTWHIEEGEEGGESDRWLIMAG